MREKLIEMIVSSGQVSGFVRGLADYLIANGVRLEEKQATSDEIKQYVTDTNVGKWIPVSERLPERPEYDWVLVQVGCHSRYGIFYSVPIVAELRHGEWYDAYDETIEGDSEKVTHWMPLPEMPKEDKC